jgi:hypothetical protein
MASKSYHITFEALDRKIIEADVETHYTPGDGFDEFIWDNVLVTDPKTGMTEAHDFMPEEYVSEAEYDAEGKLPND